MKKRTLIALLLVLLVFLSGFAVEYDNAEVRADTEAVLDALIDGDYMAFRAAISERLADDDLTNFYKQLSTALDGLGEYELNAVAKKIQVQDELNCISILYEMTAGATVYQVEVVKVEGESGLAGFYIEEAKNGIVAEEASWGMINWAFAAVGFVAWGLVIWMVVDCARRKMKRKWLWIALILLLTLVLNFRYSEGSVSFSFNLGLYLGSSDVNIYTDGRFSASIYIPLGALLYLIQRKRLTLSEDVPQEQTVLCAEPEELPAAEETAD